MRWEAKQLIFCGWTVLFQIFIYFYFEFRNRVSRGTVSRIGCTTTRQQVSWPNRFVNFHQNWYISESDVHSSLPHCNENRADSCWPSCILSSIFYNCGNHQCYGHACYANHEARLHDSLGPWPMTPTASGLYLTCNALPCYLRLLYKGTSTFILQCHIGESLLYLWTR